MSQPADLALPAVSRSDADDGIALSWRGLRRVVEGVPCYLEDWTGHEAWLARMRQEKPGWYTGDQTVGAAHGPYRHHYRKRVAYLRGLVARLRGEGAALARWADIGCGDGTDFAWMREAASSVAGVDYNPLRLLRASGRAEALGLTFRPYVADIRRMPFAEDWFDVMYMNHVLEHIREDDRVLAEAYRVLAPGGVVILGVPNEDAAWWRLAYALSPGSRQDTDHVRFYRAESIRRLCEAAGFQVAEIKHLGWGVPQWRADELLRQFKILDDAFEAVGRRLLPRQASSLYVVLRKPARVPAPAPMRVPETAQRAIQWLEQAHDATGRTGVSAWYASGRGWAPAYPEVTGYTITTLLDAAAVFRRPDLARRASAMGRWLLSIQHPEGWFRAGLQQGPATPSVFNTGQVLEGLIALATADADTAWTAAADQAAGWLCRQQTIDGSFIPTSLYCGSNKTYLARVACGLLAHAERQHTDESRRAAERLLAWVMTHRLPGGAFSACGFAQDDDRPTTHTIAYTIEGLLRAGLMSGTQAWIDTAQTAADALLEQFRASGRLAGRYTTNWQPAARYENLAGCAQMALIWWMLYGHTRRPAYRASAEAMLDRLAGRQGRGRWHPGSFGGLPGSAPIWGRYHAWRRLSWATKFHLDALLARARLQMETA